MAVDEDPSSEHARRFRIMFSHDPIIQRISREMHTFKWVPVSWLSEKWGVDVEDWLKGTTQEKRRAYGFDAKVLNDTLDRVPHYDGGHAPNALGFTYRDVGETVRDTAKSMVEQGFV